jgi:hypothetical protein
MTSIDDYVTDVLMRDLVGHDKRPVSFLVYLWLAAEQQRRSSAVQISYQELAESIGLARAAEVDPRQQGDGDSDTEVQSPEPLEAIRGRSRPTAVIVYAVARCCSWWPPNFTLTTFETPGSCMVTP